MNNQIKSFNIGSVLLLVGPPGVGKTSIAKSIANSLNRKFVKVSLGGVTDDSEIKGNRRSYVGSAPGKIINAMRKAGSLNSVVLIDEIDKMGSSRRFYGDPQSTLLEVLDPNENSTFVDTYLNIPYDLSNIVFICTANSIDGIPSPLLDRMEIIYLSSYTYLEKLEIAKKHLVPEVKASFNIDEDYELKFTDSAINIIIKHYTQEAGVRELKRIIETLSRKFLVKTFEEGIKNFEINEENLLNFLGEKKFNNYKKNRVLEPGIVNGLAYTEFGGDVLDIEVGYFEGTGKVILTGTLGEVMKESANIAVDYIKQNSEFFGINLKIFNENDIHIHVPEGAVPKDGPSAGITIATAIISSLKKEKIPSSIAMTGEITLLGRVIAIGGLREKTIAAYSNGIKTIIIPTDNKGSLSEIPKEVLENIEVLFASNYEDVWNHIKDKKSGEKL